MLRIIKKTKYINRILQTQGVKVAASVLYRENIYPLMMSIKWLNLGFGKIVEIKGNVVLIDGCQFSVCSPEITTAFKRHFFFDNYEADERHALKHFLDPRLPVIELGGALGVIACLTNKRLNYPEKHVVVEANPGIIPLLKENRDRNNCQFTILNKAVAYGTDEVTL